ncbi:MAG: hypothetical protein ABDH32_08055 [Candidatus Caldarchaeales archaeon]
MESVLKQRFHNIWYVGELDEKGVDRIIQQLKNLPGKVTPRVRIRFYLGDGKDLTYLANCRRILLENFSISIVIEDRHVDELKKDIESAREDVILIANGIHIEDIKNERIKLVEV